MVITSCYENVDRCGIDLLQGRPARIGCEREKRYFSSISHDGDGGVLGFDRGGDYRCHGYVPAHRLDDGGDDGGVHVRHGHVYGCDVPLRGGRILERMGWPLLVDVGRLVLVEVFGS